jgi:DNA-binding response OmpR family regulator
MDVLTKGKPVLVADDDQDARGLVHLGLSLLGLEVIEAANGAEAWERYQERRPALAVLDHNMPGLTGLEVCQHIRSSDGGDIVPVLMLTANERLQDKVSAFAEGVDDYLTKPFHLEELQARVKALLRVRELNQRLKEKNEEIVRMQEQLIERERQVVVTQLAGTAAHQLGQPLAAIMLNCHLLERLPSDDERFRTALKAVQTDAKRMRELIDKLRAADASQTAAYHGKDKILSIDEE